MDFPRWISDLGGILGFSGLVQWFVARRHSRRDAVEAQRVQAFRNVLAPVGALRSTGKQLEAAFDWNTPPTHEAFAPTTDAIKKAYDTIEQNREDTGAEFADAARAVVEYWDLHTDHLWNGNWDGAIEPPLDAREETMRNAIPNRYRERVAPGYC